MAAGCGKPGDDLARLVPDLDPTAAALLGDPASGGFAAFAARNSADRLLELRVPLIDVLYGDEPCDPDEISLLTGALDAVDGELRDRYGQDAYGAESAFLAGLPRERAVHLVGDYRRILVAFTDADRDPATRIAEIESLQVDLQEAGFMRGALGGWDAMAVLNHQQGQWERAKALHRLGFELSRRQGFLAQECRTWGQLMMYDMRRGWSAGQRDTLLHLIDRAREAKLALPSSSLISLLAYDAVNEGRYSSARALFEDGIAVCRELDDPTRALGTYDLLLRMYAALECWNQVDEHLAQAEQLRVDAEAASGVQVGRHLGRARHTNLAARSLAARGQADAAHAGFIDAFAMAKSLPFAEVGFLGQQWIEAMMDNERADLVAEAVATVEEFARPLGNRHVMLRLPFWRAWLAYEQGDLASASAYLDTFAAEGLAGDRMIEDNLRFQHEALRARIAWSVDPAAGERILADGWRALYERIHEGEAGPEAYLDLGRNSHLRWASQDLVGSEPEVGYGLELLWRRALLPRWPVPEDPVKGGLVETARALTRQAQARLSELEAMHCLYQVQRTSVVRWTVDGEGVQRTVLDKSADELRELVRCVLRRLGEDPGSADAPVPPELVAELGELGRTLLPAQAFDPETRPRTLFVTGESFLAQIPFSPLNLGGDDTYQPLVTVMDVAWVRGAPRDDRSPVPNAMALIVSDPTLDPGTKRRFHLPSGLPGAAAESAAIAARLPAVTMLSGDQATRSNVTSHWNEARVLYFLGHAVRDAEVPFTTWLPLAPASLTDLYPGLDIKDVLAARLDGCELVVLSGCATGAPYVDGLSTTPSLGDAFLDAGAAGVIQTFWQVRDEGSVFEPDRIVGAWQEDEMDLAAAVSAEWRRSMHGPAGIRHPFDWGAWTVKVGWF